MEHSTAPQHSSTGRVEEEATDGSASTPGTVGTVSGVLLEGAIPLATHTTNVIVAPHSGHITVQANVVRMLLCACAFVLALLFCGPRQSHPSDTMSENMNYLCFMHSKCLALVVVRVNFRACLRCQGGLNRYT